jgi:hypothetical protein
MQGKKIESVNFAVRECFKPMRDVADENPNAQVFVMLPHDGRLYPHHLDPAKDFDFAGASAEVGTHPADPNVWGLKNCTGEKWGATMPDGSVKDIEPGRSVRLADKTKVNFGKVEGEIRY